MADSPDAYLLTSSVVSHFSQFLSIKYHITKTENQELANKALATQPERGILSLSRHPGNSGDRSAADVCSGHSEMTTLVLTGR